MGTSTTHDVEIPLKALAFSTVGGVVGRNLNVISPLQPLSAFEAIDLIFAGSVNTVSDLFLIYAFVGNAVVLVEILIST